MKKTFLIILLICCSITLSTAQQTTVGLIQHSEGGRDNGYVLFAPMADSTTYLIDKCGYIIHKWTSPYQPCFSVYLMPSGRILRTGRDTKSPFFNGGGGGYFEILDWNSNVIWRYKFSTDDECPHHDIKLMPNGNILAIVWEKKTNNEAVISGMNPELVGESVWSEKIIEIKPIGLDSAEIVWEWKLWDHLMQDFDKNRANYYDIESHPELVDINFTANKNIKDWQHFNSIDYNYKIDQILISARNSSEIWIIDHSTTKEEAASHQGGNCGKGGDLIYRWGNPQAYRHGNSGNQQLFLQHNAYWITDGFPYPWHIMIFNNAHGPVTSKYSSVDILKPPVDENGYYYSELPYYPMAPVWSYTENITKDFNSVILSSAQMLKNKNVLICNGAKGIFFEIDSNKKTVWKYVNPVGSNGIVPQGMNPQMLNSVFRCVYYPNYYPGLTDKNLSRKGIIENQNPNCAVCTLFTGIEESPENRYTNVYPNPANNLLKIETDMTNFTFDIYNNTGCLIMKSENTKYVNTENLKNGIYYLLLNDNSGNYIYRKFIISR